MMHGMSYVGRYILKELLEAAGIGMRSEWHVQDGQRSCESICLFFLETGLRAFLPAGNGFKTHWESCDDLWESIVKSEKFIDYRIYSSKGMKLLPNPYYGCGSLEEAMIKKDLLNG